MDLTPFAISTSACRRATLSPSSGALTALALQRENCWRRFAPSASPTNGIALALVESTRPLRAGLNLYEFSQVNNNEMGVLIRRGDDGDLFRDAYDEAQRIIRISEEVRISLERVASQPATPVSSTPSPNLAEAKSDEAADEGDEGDGEPTAKLTTSKLAAKLGMKTAELIDKLAGKGLLELRGGKPFITDAGKAAGGEFRKGAKFGPYFLWPEGLVLEG